MRCVTGTSAMMILLLLEASFLSEACPCFYWHPQAIYCHSDFAIKAAFLHESEWNDPIFPGNPRKGYAIKPKEEYKGNNWFQNVTFISSLANTSCEYSHNADQFNIDYLITGFRDNTPSLYVTACSLITPWSQLSPMEIAGVQGAYDAGCSCQIIEFNPPSRIAGENECLMNDADCEDDDAIQRRKRDQMCAPNEKGTCTWKKLEEVQGNSWAYGESQALPAEELNLE
ncbi:metalloproteinase inhibitor 1-like [Ambystoma mexicanum]|uniref:metalloproteinase inhibitor 1-like n=1 Tax=Ambystoma mexicanum TaxID=8296 RepID=UPI0037E75EDA